MSSSCPTSIAGVAALICSVIFIGCFSPGWRIPEGGDKINQEGQYLVSRSFGINFQRANT